ncbi:MAG: DUF5990 family protein [Acidobacteriota bacterium]
MDSELTLRIVLVSPPAGVDFALQKGRAGAATIVGKQRSTGTDLRFEFTARVKDSVLLGPFVQGPPAERFVYINIGTCAGQADSTWTRRLKVPLRDISAAMLRAGVLEARVPATAKDGSPTCATVKPFAGWHPANP